MIPMESIYTSGNPLPLFDQGATAASTRAQAHQDAKPKQTERVTQAIKILEEVGPSGLIRHELADAMGIPLSSVCSIALAVLGAGKVIERGTRLSPYQKPAAVLIHIDHTKGGTDE